VGVNFEKMWWPSTKWLFFVAIPGYGILAIGAIMGFGPFGMWALPISWAATFAWIGFMEIPYRHWNKKWLKAMKNHKWA